ncbi:hypothetical protein EST38_g10439 [Candolleomyces aberdarensis]|uniref:Major facilitator superfamily (MFS) profile domain-containing protein n=1 Tax=Candolleomyces aberdarensis TaxID=2316362 RepID=A0A4Q2D9T7_9AGAR|nr:hypothetical protein EST38_g10439 [Candolleomyces aberdarensis]
MGVQDTEAGQTPHVESSTKRDSQSMKAEVQADEKPAQAQIDTPRDLWLFPVPRYLRHDPNNPHHFGWVLNLAFGFATMFTAANLYYCQPILIQLSESFHVDYNAVSRIPTLVQAGYAAGLLLISPLGDLVRRRQLVIILQVLATTLTIGLAVTSDLVVFEVLTFIVGVVTVVPQILLPLAADLAPPNRRGTVLSIILSGLLLGILVARLLSGIIAEYSSWRVVYYFAIGVQVAVLLGSYLMLPDYPSKNDHLNYWDIMWSMAKLAVTEPVLVQGSLINIASSACFSNFWVTLTFLLDGEPFNYSTLVIGLFGLVGMAGVALGPALGYLVDRLEAWYASLVSIILGTIFLSIQLGAGGINVAAVIIAAFGISPHARSRMNAVFILAFFIGQVIGTSVGTLVFVKYGWRACAALNVGWMGFQLLVLISRGPHCRQYTPTEAGSKASVTMTGAVGNGSADSQTPEEDAALSSSLHLEKKQGIETRLSPVIGSSKEKVNA